MTLVRCYADDEYGAFWEMWVTSCGESWRAPLTAQMAAMFPHLCSYAKFFLFRGEPWCVMTPSYCWQRSEPDTGIEQAEGLQEPEHQADDHDHVDHVHDAGVDGELSDPPKQQAHDK